MGEAVGESKRKKGRLRSRGRSGQGGQGAEARPQGASGPLGGAPGGPGATGASRPETALLLEREGDGEFKAKGSRFVASAFFAADVDEFMAKMERRRQAHPTARHCCWAYRLGVWGDVERSFDDGEPSSTAGRPILGRIRSLGATMCGVTVARYFGGVLLGTSGLIVAYKSAAQAALDAAAWREAPIVGGVAVTIPASQYGWAANLAAKNGGRIEASSPCADGFALDLAVPLSRLPTVLSAVRSNPDAVLASFDDSGRPG